MYNVTLKPGQYVMVDNMKITYIESRRFSSGKKLAGAKLGVDAPRENMILRGEIFDKLMEAVEESDKKFGRTMCVHGHSDPMYCKICRDDL